MSEKLNSNVVDELQAENDAVLLKIGNVSDLIASAYDTDGIYYVGQKSHEPITNFGMVSSVFSTSIDTEGGGLNLSGTHVTESPSGMHWSHEITIDSMMEFLSNEGAIAGATIEYTDNGIKVTTQNGHEVSVTHTIRSSDDDDEFCVEAYIDDVTSPTQKEYQYVDTLLVWKQIVHFQLKRIELSNNDNTVPIMIELDGGRLSTIEIELMSALTRYENYAEILGLPRIDFEKLDITMLVGISRDRKSLDWNRYLDNLESIAAKSRLNEVEYLTNYQLLAALAT